MKRYGLSIVFVVFMTVCIGTFYIQAAGSRSPAFILAKQQGDEQAVEGVSLRGYYGQGRVSPAVIISTAGSKYMNQQSLLERMDQYYGYNADIKRLIAEHRHFMRGKHEAAAFFENDKLLVYANVQTKDGYNIEQREFSFIVSVLNKEQKQTFSYQIAVPNSEPYHYINVQDVQVFADQIVVVTNNYGANQSGYHRYSLGLTEKRTAEEQLIILSNQKGADPGDGTEPYELNAFKIEEKELTKAGRYLVFYQSETRNVDMQGNAISREQMESERFQQEFIHEQWLVYDLLTAELVEITAPKVAGLLNNDNGLMGFVYMKVAGEKLLLAKQAEAGVQVFEYSIPDASVIQYAVPVQSVFRSEMKDNRIYMLVKEQQEIVEPPALLVADLLSGEVLYKGSIGLEQEAGKQADELKKLDIGQIIIE